MNDVEIPQDLEEHGPPRRRQRFWIACGILTGVPLLGFLAMWFYARQFVLRTPYSDREAIAFTQAGWQQGEHDWEGSRFLMMQDLIAKHPLVGLRRQEVIELLGPFHPGEYPGFGDCYFLGPEDHPLAIDNAWLVLTFSDDVVTKWEVATD